jgi:uncharacterized delta-60 repeat protein
MDRTRPLRGDEMSQSTDHKQPSEGPTRKLFTICYLFFLILLTNPRSLWALAPGDLDPTFGTGGIGITPLGSFDDFASAVALQPDGKIVVAGQSSSGSNNSDFALARYNPDGSLDASFGSGGKITTAIGSRNAAYAVALQPDGKIIAAGFTYIVGDGDIALVRYNPDGSLDTTFGTGGTIRTSIGNSGEDVHGVALQPDGKIVAAGSSLTVNESDRDFTLVRYNPDGSLDINFGNEGKIITNIQGTGSSDIARAVVVQPNGKIVVAGHSSGIGSAAFALVRYNSDGSRTPPSAAEARLRPRSGAGEIVPTPSCSRAAGSSRQVSH